MSDRCGKLEVKIHELTMTLSKMEEDKLRRESEYQESLRQEKDRLAQVFFKYYVSIIRFNI